MSVLDNGFCFGKFYAKLAREAKWNKGFVKLVQTEVDECLDMLKMSFVLCLEPSLKCLVDGFEICKFCANLQKWPKGEKVKLRALVLFGFCEFWNKFKMIFEVCLRLV